MNLAGLNTNKVATEATATVSADFVSPYLIGETDPVRRMYYPARAAAARPLPEVIICRDPDKVAHNIKVEGNDVLDRFLSATGQENNKPRKARYAGRVFFNFTNREGEVITRGVLVSIVKASHIFDIVVGEDGSMTPVLTTLPKFLIKYGFLDKDWSKGKKADDKVEVPLLADFNSHRLSLSGKNYVCTLAATAFIDTGEGNKTSFWTDVRVTEQYIAVDDMARAIENETKGTNHKVKSSVTAFVKTAILFSLSMTENLRILKGEQEKQAPRDIFRMFGMELTECYYGKAELSNKENHGLHALLGGVYDLATMGGKWEEVSDDRVVNDEGWTVQSLVNNNR